MSTPLPQAALPLADYRASFARHLRQPRHAPRADLPARGAAVYAELVENNLRTFLDRCFPVARACLGEPRWQALCRAFLRRHPMHSPWFRDIPGEFADWLARTAPPRLPRWLAALARHEWSELALETLAVADPCLPPTDDATTDGQLLTGHPVANPACLLLAHDWPVHRIGPAWRPRKPQATWIATYRVADGPVRFAALSPASAQLLKALTPPTVADAAAPSGVEAIRQVAHAAGLDADAALYQYGQQCLAQLRALGLILGVRP